jgi:hypothetical protein
MRKSYFLILFNILFYLVINTVIGQDFNTSNFISGSDNIRVNETIKLTDGYVLFGDFLGTINRPETIAADNRDIFLAKYDDNFNPIWINHIGGTLIDLANDIVTDLQDNIYILGSFQDKCSFNGTNELLSDGNYDVFIAKYTSSGTFIWAKKIAFNATNQRGSSIDFDGTTLIVGGYYTGTIGFDSQGFTSSYGMYIAKFDLNGTFIWAKNIPTTSSSSTIQSVSVFSDGYYFNGTIKGAATFDLGIYNSNNANYTDVFLYKTDFNGTGQWLRRTYGDANAFTGTMTQDNYGNVYFTGYFSGTNMSVDSTGTIKGKNAIINQGSTDMFILKYNKSGKMIWSKGFGETGTEWARDIKYKNNAFYLTGYFSGSITFGTDVLSSSSTLDQDAFIGVLDSQGNTLRAVKIDDSDDGNESGMTASIDDDNTIYWGGTFRSTTVIVGDSTFINPYPGKQGVYMTKGKAPFSVAFSVKENPSCYQSDNGELVITPYFGTAPYTYSWSHDGALLDSTATNLAPGTYSVTVTDGTLATDDATYILTEPDPITFNPSITQVTQCSYSEEGLIDLNILGGNGGNTYQWQASAGGEGVAFSAEDQSGLTVGTYHVTVTDSKGCTADTIMYITGPDPVTFGGSVVTDSSGIGPGAIDLSFSGGFGTPASFTFNWTGSYAFSETTEDISNLNTGNYDVTVTDVHLCEFDTIFNVANLDTFYIFISEHKDACNGTINGTATVSYYSPDSHTAITYLWDANAGSQTTAQATSLAPGRYYYVTVTDTENTPNTVLVDSVYISELAYSFTGSLTGTTIVNCYGDTDGYIDLSITSQGTKPYVYNWSTGSTVQDLTNLGIGTYGVTVTDKYSCIFSITNYTIDQPTVLSAVAEIVTKPTCYGDFDGEVTVDRSGGTSPYTYQWDDPGFQDTRNADGLDAGNYSVTVTDVNNCEASSSIHLTQPGLINAAKSITNEICNSAGDGAITLTVTGGTIPFSYSWSTTEGSGLIPTDKNQTGLTAGKYYFTASDDNNCLQSDSAEITEPPLLQITNEEKTDVLGCNGESTGSITITATGGTGVLTYTLNPGAIQTNNTGVFTGLGEGTYTVNVDDAVGCGPITSSSMIITEPDLLVIVNDNVNNATCNGTDNGSIYITVNGGTVATDYNYTWTTSNGSGLIPGVQDQPTLGAGTYNLTVTDDNACEATTSFVLTEPTAINVSKLKYDLNCNGDNNGAVSLIVSGGVSPYAYLWTTTEGSGLIASDKNQSGLTAGKYYFSVTDDNNCAYNDSVEITEPPLLEITSQLKTNVSECQGESTGTITITATGGTGVLTYTLNPGAIQTNNTGSFTGLNAGNYTVNVQDENLCSVTSGTLSITEPGALVITTNSTSNLTCNGTTEGNIFITVAGGTISTDYTYTWTTTNGSGLSTGVQDQPDLGAGTYYLTVSDDYSCEATANFTLTEPDTIIVTKTTYNLSCSTGNDGVIVISHNGGVLPFSYFWTTLDGSGLSPVDRNQGGLSAGTYYLELTDAIGCVVNETIELTAPPAITIDSENFTDATGQAIADGTITIEASGGTGVLTYTLLPNNKSNQTGIFNALVPGDYSVNVRDENYCGPVSSNTITIGFPDAIEDILANDFIKIYPNPTSDKIFIEFEYKDELVNLQLISISGEILLNKEIKSQGFTKEEIDLSKYSKGVYFIRVYNNQFNINNKILLQ